MRTKTIKQRVFFKANPQEIYNLLMDSEKHSLITGSEAKINPEIGGKISAYDGYVDGENVELVKNKKIVQKWRGSDWPKGHYSLATFELKGTDNGTELIFTQISVPENEYEMVSSGWYEYYWDPIMKMFEKG